ncbi:MAG TPA: hypothetical protein VNZ52_07265 [Candidatus Thermoplasmatota archaeon]|nr:hypothetical protein [Candidatus Thermoplasmatota archaeon]
MSSARYAATLVLALLIFLSALPAPAGAFHEDLPRLAEGSVTGGHLAVATRVEIPPNATASFGYRIESPSAPFFESFSLYGGAGDLKGMFSGFGSGSSAYGVNAEIGGVREFTWGYRSTGGSGGWSETVLLTWNDGTEPLTLIFVFWTAGDAEAVSWYQGGSEGVTVEAVSEGTNTHLLVDRDFRAAAGFSADLPQAERAGLGATVAGEANVTVTKGLFGHFLARGSPHGCVFSGALLSYCAQAPTLAHLSWSGPGQAAEESATAIEFANAAPGEYVFRVDTHASASSDNAYFWGCTGLARWTCVDAGAARGTVVLAVADLALPLE